MHRDGKLALLSAAHRRKEGHSGIVTVCWGGACMLSDGQVSGPAAAWLAAARPGIRGIAEMGMVSEQWVRTHSADHPPILLPLMEMVTCEWVHGSFSKSTNHNELGIILRPHCAACRSDPRMTSRIYSLAWHEDPSRLLAASIRGKPKIVLTFSA